MKRLHIIHYFLVVFSAIVCVFFAFNFAKAASFTIPHPRAIIQRQHIAVCSFAIGPKEAKCNARVVTDNTGKPMVTSGPTGYGPVQFHSAYNLPVNAGGGNPIIAIVDAYDDPNAYADLTNYSNYYGIPVLPQCNGSIGSFSGPCFAKINQNGGTSLPSANSGWGLEISLDIQVAHAMCQNCKILLVETNSNSLTNLLTGVSQAVSQGAVAVSNSWAANEFSGETSYDSYFNHPGVAITAASGDSGFSAGTAYPAASQYVVSVGGTTLQLNTDNTYFGESVWNGTGSGCSKYETKPFWQTDNGCSKRTLNDVSADADPSTGASVYDTYGYAGWLQVGGTSLATPIIASVYALAGVTPSVQEGSMPYANVANLYDVTSGSNGNCGTYLCNAQISFDGPTGLGTPNGLNAFTGTSLPTPTFGPSPTLTPTLSPTPTLTPSPTPLPITITITNPKNNAVVSRNTIVGITTNTSSNVVLVKFYVNNSQVCSLNISPFNCNWTVPNRRFTTFTIKAVAYDNVNRSTQTSIKVSTY
ncbi:MAG: Ig-like domain-containing protein [Candidatus Levyibacteriota bacterium]